MRKLLVICSVLVLSIAMSVVALAKTAECSNNNRVRVYSTNPSEFEYAVFVNNATAGTVQVTIKWNAPMASDDNNRVYEEVITLEPNSYEVKVGSGKTNTRNGKPRLLTISCF